MSPHQAFYYSQWLAYRYRDWEILTLNSGNGINLRIPAPSELHVLPKIFGKMAECVSECDEDSEDVGSSIFIVQISKAMKSCLLR